MPVNLASPGISVKELDLTVGRIDPSSDKVGAIVAPFTQGPVEFPLTVNNEKELLETFGRPHPTDKHYEYWLSASSYLAYGGSLSVVRAASSTLVNAGAGNTARINSVEHYEQLGYDDTTISGVVAAARNPGSWANGLRIGIIDSKSDQIITVNDGSGVGPGAAVTANVPNNTVVAGVAGTSLLQGYFKGIVTNVDGTEVEVKLVAHVDENGTEVDADYTPDGVYKFTSGTLTFGVSGSTTNTLNVTRAQLGSTSGNIANEEAITAFTKQTGTFTVTTQGNVDIAADGTVIGMETAGLAAGANNFLLINNEFISLASATITANQITLSGVGARGAEGTTAAIINSGTSVGYYVKSTGQETDEEVGDEETSIDIDGGTTAVFNSGTIIRLAKSGGGNEFMSVTSFIPVGGTSGGNRTISTVKDWFNEQTLTTGEGTSVKWNSIADRPGTSEFASARASRFDEVHVAVVDGDGKISGNAGTILETHLSLSKAKDAIYSSGSPSYWRRYLKNNSNYIFGGTAPANVATDFSSGTTAATAIEWDNNAQGRLFGGAGNYNQQLSGGVDYGNQTSYGSTGALKASLSDMITGYGLFENTEKYDIDFLLMGSANYTKEEAQSLALKLISVAEIRKDAIAFISPHRSAFITDTDAGTVTVSSDADITNNVLDFYSSITSSSYAVFDSGYKYMYDRFSNTFRYAPLNADIAGLCARNDINNYPWFSPAGTARGGILNAVKLAYNPTKAQRDLLYSARINPVIFSPGSGIILFGDKTGYAKSSAFDRINVRRLFLYLEDAISAAAKDQLFEFNDEITRSNFVNTVDPFLRDVQAKRGIQDYIVVCDETNNTAAVIDNNEFVADIYIKPARSINFIGLTFVATRTGVAFEEVVGNV